MVNFYFVRHGRTDFNVKRIIQGQGDRAIKSGIVDQPLNKEGLAQAKLLCKLLKQHQIVCDIVLSSPLLRALQTAQYIAKYYDVRLLTDNGLREMFFGTNWEGMLVEDFNKVIFDPPYIIKNFVTNTPIIIKTGKLLRVLHKSTDPEYDLLSHPGGETKIAVKNRVIETLLKFIKQHADYRHICIPCHNAMLRFFLSSIDRKIAAISVGHTEIVHVRFDIADQQWSIVARIKE